jgi:hypothetical protein
MEGIDRRATVAAAKPERRLNDAELDQVAAAGGKSATSGNPVED